VGGRQRRDSQLQRPIHTDRGEGTGDQFHHIVGGGIAASNAGCVRAIQQVRDMAGEVCRDVRGGGAKVELGGGQRALHSALFTAGSPFGSLAKPRSTA
jgi:hypothetical protein